MRELNINIISDFNIEYFGRCLQNSDSDRNYSVRVGEFDQVYQELNKKLEVMYDATIIWTRPEYLFSTFHNALRFNEIEFSSLEKEIDVFINTISKYQECSKYTFVTSWLMPPGYRGYGLIDMNCHVGLSHALMKANVQLIDGLSQYFNIYVLNSDLFFKKGYYSASNPSLWFTGKIHWRHSMQ